MPPVRRLPSIPRGGTRSLPPRRRRRLPARPRAASAAPNFARNYRTGTKVGKTRAGKGNNVIKLTTMSRKKEMVSINFREQLDFTSMGYGIASANKPLQTPTLIRVDLANPCIGGVNGTGNRNIVTVVSKLIQNPPGTGVSVDPIFQRSSYEDASNLSSRLAEYFDEYRSIVVTGAEVTFSIRPKLNQIGRLGIQGDALSLVPYFTNETDTEGNTHLFTNNPNLSGELVVWTSRQSNQGQLYDNDGVYSNIDLKTSVPGVRMQKLNVTPTGARGCTYVMKYSPSTQWSLRDWRDNKQFFEMNNAPTLPTGFKNTYAYLGIGIDTKDGTRFGWRPANCTIEVNVKYNIEMSERRNVRGNNEPVPHQGEF